MKDNWSEFEFSEIIKSSQLGTDLIGNENNSGIPLLKMGNLTVGGFSFKKLEKLKVSDPNEVKKFVLNKGDFLFNTRNTLELVGKSAVWNNALSLATFNSNIMRIKFIESLADDFYLGYYFSVGEGWAQFKSITTGTTSVAAIYSRDLFKCEINLPPLPQQKKIAKILSEVDNVIEKTESAIAKYQAIKQGLMHDLFELQSDNYWSFCELGDIANIIDPHPSHRAPIIDDRGIPFVGIGDIDESGNLIKNARKVSEKIFDEHSLRYKLSDKTIGFGRVATIGKIIRFKNYDFKFTVSPTMAIINPIKIESDYLSFALDSNYMKTQIDKLLTGSTRSSLGIELLRKLIVKVPVDADEKIKISKALNSIVQKIDLEKQALAKYQQLKAGLLQDLLTGKVEVGVNEEFEKLN